WPLLILNMVLIMIIFVVLDRRFVAREGEEGKEALELMDAADERTPIGIEGAHNFAFLALIIVAVILNGSIPQMEMFINPATGKTYGTEIFGVHVGVDYVVQIGLILVALILSWVTTPKALRRRNNFEWAPIAEVAKLFIGIFITMIPALALLRAYGGSIGIDTPLKFFWATGALSSFLDNSPTYVVFLTAAGAIGSTDPSAVVTTVGNVAQPMLLAISAGAVFMGAVTYIGNAPNFMVKNIAESAGIKMPSFFAYIGWSVAILIPIFIVDTIVFFL
ncbi:MAG: sodium:proton antiporter, partial [Eggerthellaceae bacterium]|nr:sodium:proton antiporter [Eggerthellaceae bacterium]